MRLAHDHRRSIPGRGERVQRVGGGEDSVPLGLGKVAVRGASLTQTGALLEVALARRQAAEQSHRPASSGQFVHVATPDRLTEGVQLVFEDDAVEALADYAFQVNQTSQNIGARRLYTIMERLLEELSFEAPDMKMGRVVVNATYVRERLDEVTQDEDLSKFIL